MEPYKENPEPEGCNYGLICDLCNKPARYICSCMEPKAKVCSQHIDSHKYFNQSNKHQVFDRGIDLSKNKPSYIESLQLCLVFLSAKKQNYIKTFQEKIVSLNNQLTEILKNLEDVEKTYQQAILWVLNNSEIVPNKINKTIFDILSLGRSGTHFIFTNFQKIIKDEPYQIPCEYCTILQYENQEIRDKAQQTIEWNEILKKMMGEYVEEIKMRQDMHVPPPVPAPDSMPVLMSVPMCVGVPAIVPRNNPNQQLRNKNQKLKNVLEGLIGILDEERNTY